MTHALRTLFPAKQTKSFNAYIESTVSLLKDLCNKNLITQGTILHGHLLKTGVSSERFITVKLLIMYLNSRKSTEADQIRKDLNVFDLVVANCMITASMQWGNLHEAQKLFDEMPDRNEVSWTALIAGFMKHGRVKESMWYFDNNPFQNVVSWTAAISGLVQNGFVFESLEVFLRLLQSSVKPNEITFTSVIRACWEMYDFELGMSVIGLIVKSGFEHYVSVSNSVITLCLRRGEISLASQLFDKIEKKDVVSWTTMLDVYAGMGDLDQARKIFEEMPKRNEVSWSTMIARYAQTGNAKESLKLFREMIQCGFDANISCLSSVLSALASLGALWDGISIHAYAMKLGLLGHVFVSSSLVDMYCKCGETKAGRSVFNSISEKNIVSWNSMVSGYSQNGQMEEAKELFEKMGPRNSASWSAIISGYLESQECDKVFEVFNEMLLCGEIPNGSTFSSVLGACSSMASLERGKNLHGKLTKLGMQCDIVVGTALTDMYAKSGDIKSSKQAFDRMHDKNEISWTVMIQALAESGFAEESLNLFEEMERTKLINPNELMLLSILFACSHAGLVDKGLEYFNAMETVYGVKPKGKHYTCVVDMLSRAGRIYEAEEFINSMPFEAEANALAALLSGCKTCKNQEIGERTARRLLEVAEKNPAGYVLLSNIYASAGKWTDVSKIRKMMKEKGLKKSGGYSWVEIRDEVHSFCSGDATHSQSPEIYGTLELLMTQFDG